MAAVDAKGLAIGLARALKPGCERLEIAGSIRRGKPAPKDIELVAIPLLISTPQKDLFDEVVGESVESRLDQELARLLEIGAWEYDQVLKRNGPRYKRLRHVASGLCCDLYITTAERWGVNFTLRTGPADFSRELVTRARRRGMIVEEGRLWREHRDGRKSEIATPTEQAFFEALGLSYLEPAQRRLEKAIFTKP